MRAGHDSKFSGYAKLSLSKTIAVVCVDQRIRFFAGQGFGPFINVFQLFDLGTQDITETAL